MRIVLFALFSWSGLLAQAQNGMDSSYKTTYYEQKVTMFRLLPDTKGEIIFLGNSITDIAEWSEIWGDTRVKNRGISSDNTFGVLARLDEVVSSRPAKIFIMIGINDLARGLPDSVILSNYRKILERIKASTPKTAVYVQSILPTNNEFTEFKRHQNKDEHIRAVNNGLKDLCARLKATYVDLHTRFLNSEGKLDRRYTNDGLHINGAGYFLWKSILVQKGYMP